ncbi:MAG: hypothetical protein U0X73_02305 [Thermoanaerobaculia bacterium]
MALSVAAAALAQSPVNRGGERGESGCVESPNLAADGQWYCFAWGSNPSGAVIFADPVFATGPNRIDVTDCFCSGDSFRVRVDGQVIGTTPPVPPEAGCDRFQDDLDRCFADPTFSHATFQLASGQHTVQIEVVDDPFNGGGGAIRAHRVIQAIPTLSQIGLALFLLVLLGASLLILRRRRSA